jgi:hypothetical protein
MRHLLLAALLVTVPASAQQYGGEESVFRRAAEAAKTHTTTLPSATRTPTQRSSNQYIGPLTYNGVRGAIINNEGDSRAARARMQQKKILIEAERAAGLYNPPEEYTLHGQPVATTAERNGEWYSDSFYNKHEDANRVRLDAWTFQRGFRHNAFVLSCVYDRESQTGGNLKFFIKGLDPVGFLGADTTVVVKIAGSTKETFRLDGRVSHVRSTNVHIDISDQYLIDRMRDARTFSVMVQSITNPRPVTMDFSLMGFASAAANTITNCMEGVQ